MIRMFISKASVYIGHFFYARVNPYVAGGKFGHCKMIHKTCKKTETLAHGHSYESNQ